MLKRTKYSRLRNDSLTSLDDRPQRMFPLARDVCSDSGAPADHRQSTLRDFIPRVANIRLQSPLSLRGRRGQATTARDKSTSGHRDKPLSRTERDSGHGDPSLSGSPIPEPDPVQRCTKRTVTLQRVDGCAQCGGKESSAVDDCAVEGRVVHHHIKYVGSVEVRRSMRTLDFNTRLTVTREAISRLCERTSGKTAVKTRRRVCPVPSAILGPIDLQFCGSRIILSVSTDSLTLSSASSLQQIAHHPMQEVSFASGGDLDMKDFIAYVAKDPSNRRACHILQCPHGGAPRVMDSIGRAFETRFRQTLSQKPPLLPSSTRSAATICHKWLPEDSITEQRAEQVQEVRASRDYYNEVPGEAPPAGGEEHLRLTQGDHNLDSDIQEVCCLYVNCSVPDGPAAPPAAEASTEQDTEAPDLIQDQGWFHGRLDRGEAESLLSVSGDFLVRQSSSCGQYVLSGMEGATVRHLLLVDPHGQVRTRDQVFLSVAHLVRFHMESRTPIVCGSSELCLKQPVTH